MEQLSVDGCENFFDVGDATAANGTGIGGILHLLYCGKTFFFDNFDNLAFHHIVAMANFNIFHNKWF